MPYPTKDQASGSHGDKIGGSTDGRKRGSAPTKGGSGFIERKGASGRDSGPGAKGAPSESGHQYGMKAAKKGGVSPARIKDGVGKPLPSA